MSPKIWQLFFVMISSFAGQICMKICLSVSEEHLRNILALCEISPIFFRLFNGYCEQRNYDPVEKNPITTCETGWVSFQRSCYYFSTSKGTFKEAMLACYQMGAELLELQHAKEEEWFDLQNRLRNEMTEVWLGASDIKEEGKFVYVSNAEKIYYAQWVRRRPDNIGKNEHCLTYDVALKGMNDAKCDSRFNYACNEQRKNE